MLQFNTNCPECNAPAHTNMKLVRILGAGSAGWESLCVQPALLLLHPLQLDKLVLAEPVWVQSHLGAAQHLPASSCSAWGRAGAGDRAHASALGPSAGFSLTARRRDPTLQGGDYHGHQLRVLRAQDKRGELGRAALCFAGWVFLTDASWSGPLGRDAVFSGSVTAIEELTGFWAGWSDGASQRGELTAAVAGEVRRSDRATGDQDHPADHRPVRHDEGRPEGTGTFKPALSSLSRSLTAAPLSLQSETCSVEIPELEFELGMGALGGKFTTLEGLLKDVRDLVSGPGA